MSERNWGNGSGLRTAIASKLSTLTPEQLSAVLFDINAITAGVEFCNQELGEMVAQNEALRTQLKATKERAYLLSYQVAKLEEENRRLKLGTVEVVGQPQELLYRGS